MSKDPAELDAFIEASAHALDLPLDPLWKPAIRNNLSVVFTHAGKVADFALPDEAEPAPVFRA